MKKNVSELVRRIEDTYGNPQYEIDSITVNKETGGFLIECHVKEEEESKADD